MFFSASLQWHAFLHSMLLATVLVSLTMPFLITQFIRCARFSSMMMDLTDPRTSGRSIRARRSRRSPRAGRKPRLYRSQRPSRQPTAPPCHPPDVLVAHPPRRRLRLPLTLSTIPLFSLSPIMPMHSKVTPPVSSARCTRYPLTVPFISPRSRSDWMPSQTTAYSTSAVAASSLARI